VASAKNILSTTTDRQIAERKLKKWISNLDKVDAEAEKMTLAQLIEKFEKTRRGKAEKTQQTEQWLINTLKAEWCYGLEMRVSQIRPSHLDEWLAKLELRMRNSSYNRVTLFLKQLFDLAVNDRVIAEDTIRANPEELEETRETSPEGSHRRTV
jgi:hypothetical protein